MATAAERKHLERKRKRAKGLIEVRGIWAHPNDHAAIKRYARQTSEQRNYWSKR